MSSGHIDILGRIHKFRWIADIVSFDTKKAEPKLTLPYTVLFKCTLPKK